MNICYAMLCWTYTVEIFLLLWNKLSLHSNCLINWREHKHRDSKNILENSDKISFILRYSRWQTEFLNSRFPRNRRGRRRKRQQRRRRSSIVAKHLAASVTLVQLGSALQISKPPLVQFASSQGRPTSWTPHLSGCHLVYLKRMCPFRGEHSPPPFEN